MGNANHKDWVRTDTNHLPDHAVQAGHDTDGDLIYVCRAEHNGDAIPGKFIPSRKQAYLAWGGGEHSKFEIQVLTGHHYRWVRCDGGRIPNNAVEGGRLHDGEILYIGRAHWEGSLTPGKIQPSHHCLFISYGGAEQKLYEFEVLVQD